jgi:hypothetical protein
MAPNRVLNPRPHKKAMLINFKLIRTWRPNVVVANTATHKQVNFLTPPKGSVKKKGHSKLTQKAMSLILINRTWRPNVRVLIPEAMYLIFKSKNMTPNG